MLTKIFSKFQKNQLKKLIKYTVQFQIEKEEAQFLKDFNISYVTNPPKLKNNLKSFQAVFILDAKNFNKNSHDFMTFNSYDDCSGFVKCEANSNHFEIAASTEELNRAATSSETYARKNSETDHFDAFEL